MMSVSFVECNYLNKNEVGTKSVRNPKDKMNRAGRYSF